MGASVSNAHLSLDSLGAMALQERLGVQSTPSFGLSRWNGHEETLATKVYPDLESLSSKTGSELISKSHPDLRTLDYERQDAALSSRGIQSMNSLDKIN